VYQFLVNSKPCAIIPPFGEKSGRVAFFMLGFGMVAPSGNFNPVPDLHLFFAMNSIRVWYIR